MNTTRRIVPFPVRHVNDLIGQGYTPWGIARAAGIGTTTVHRGMNSGHCAPITRDQWDLLKAGSTASGKLPGLKALGVAAHPLGLFLDRWMVRFRKHGRFGEKASPR